MTRLIRYTDGPEDWEPYLIGDEQFGEVCRLPVPQQPGGALAAGIWRSGPATDVVRPYVVAGTETMYVIEGEAELGTGDGQRIRLTPGDVVTLPDGFTGTWRTVRPFRKFFVLDVG